jgi:hypothetical protein
VDRRRLGRGLHPVECARSRETVKRSDLAGWAQYGYCASHSRWFWGLRLHLVTTLHGLPVGFALAGAKADERQVLLGILADDSLAGRPGQVIIGDKNYYGRDFERELAAARLVLLQPARKGEPEPAGRQYFKLLRQVIESVNDTLKGQLDLAENRRYLREGGNHYIIGERLRSGSPEADAALSRPGRYKDVAANLKVKEVRIAEDEQFVICHNPEGAVPPSPARRGHHEARVALQDDRCRGRDVARSAAARHHGRDHRAVGVGVACASKATRVTVVEAHREIFDLIERGDGETGRA